MLHLKCELTAGAALGQLRVQPRSAGEGGQAAGSFAPLRAGEDELHPSETCRTVKCSAGMSPPAASIKNFPLGLICFLCKMRL